MGRVEDSIVSTIISKITSEFEGSDTILFAHSFKGDDTVVVKSDSILELLKFLKNDSTLNYSMLLDITAADYLKGRSIKPANRKLQPYLDEGNYRFEVVYHLYSFLKNHTIRVKVPLKMESLNLNSVTSFYPGASWLEREVWDMYGIKFLAHPDLRRILLYEEFEGHPLRKDYEKTKRQPLIGPTN
ncbi:MAG: NADH-quinone oxidoreductase subunit C [Nitrospinota bacterium]